MEWKKKHYDISGHNIESADMSAWETEVEFCLSIQGMDVSDGMKDVEVYPEADCIDSVCISGLNIFSAMRDEHDDQEMAGVLLEWLKELDLPDFEPREPWREALSRMHELNTQAWELAIANSSNSSFQSEMESVAAIVGQCELCGEKKPCKKCGGE